MLARQDPNPHRKQPLALALPRMLQQTFEAGQLAL